MKYSESFSLLSATFDIADHSTVSAPFSFSPGFPSFVIIHVEVLGSAFFSARIYNSHGFLISILALTFSLTFRLIIPTLIPEYIHLNEPPLTELVPNHSYYSTPFFTSQVLLCFLSQERLALFIYPVV